jgi:hypothetical protein
MEEAMKFAKRFNDFDDAYDEAKSDIRPYCEGREWDQFCDALEVAWKKVHRSK